MAMLIPQTGHPHVAFQVSPVSLLRPLGVLLRDSALYAVSSSSSWRISHNLLRNSMLVLNHKCLKPATCEMSNGRTTVAPIHLEGLQELAESGQYKAWLLDQFGVLHDGKKAYPGAVDALQRLASTGACLVLISNSSKRAQVTVDKLPGLGFDPALFAGVVTSGELTHQNLLRREDPWFAGLGRKCLHFTWSSRGSVSLEGLGLEVVENPEDADFILAHGTEALGLADGSVRSAALEELETLLQRTATLPRKIPMVVANPDMVTVEVRALRVMPGTLGLKYEELGGEVRWMGKPDPVIYKAALGMAIVGPHEAIAVGDSLHHDIRGAARGGIASIFVGGGIHAHELKISQHGEKPNGKALESLLHAQGADPDYVVPSFQW